MKARLEPKTDSWAGAELFGIWCQFISLSEIWRFSETICCFLRTDLVWRHCKLLFANESHDKEMNPVDRPHEAQLCWEKMIRFSLLRHLWVCQEWLSSSGHFMDSLHLMKCRFIGRVFHLKFPQLLHSHLRNKGPQTHYRILAKAWLWCHDMNWNDS